MSRDHLVEMQMKGSSEAEARRDRPEIRLGSRAIHASDLESTTAPQRQSRLGPVNGKPEAAERPLATPAWIDKTEMQARASAHRN
jgi:hypothetical protein